MNTHPNHVTAPGIPPELVNAYVGAAKWRDLTERLYKQFKCFHNSADWRDRELLEEVQRELETSK